jgi:hypothetical protein
MVQGDLVVFLWYTPLYSMGIGQQHAWQPAMLSAPWFKYADLSHLSLSLSLSLSISLSLSLSLTVPLSLCLSLRSAPTVHLQIRK